MAEHLATGEQEFSYEGSDLSNQGSILIAVGTVWIGLIATMAFFAFSTSRGQPHEQNAPTWAIGLGLALFACFGIGMIKGGIEYRKAASNERILLTPSDITWIDRNGQQRIRASFDQIMHVDEKQFGQARAGGQGSNAPVHHKCVVTTLSGEIVFSDNIANYEALKELLLSKERQVVSEGVFTYRSSGKIIGGAIGILLGIVVLAGAITMYRMGTIISMNGVDEPTPLFLVFFALVWSGGFGTGGAYTLLNSLNEKIVVSGDQVSYFDLSGKCRVNTSLASIERGSYSSRKSMVQNGGYKYTVAPPKGVVKWSDAISGCTDLCRILEAASNNPAPFRP